MNPGRIVDICRMVRKIDSGLAGHLLTTVMAGGSLKAVEDCLNDYKAALGNR